MSCGSRCRVAGGGEECDAGSVEVHQTGAAVGLFNVGSGLGRGGLITAQMLLFISGIVQLILLPMQEPLGNLTCYCLSVPSLSGGPSRRSQHSSRLPSDLYSRLREADSTLFDIPEPEKRNFTSGASHGIQIKLHSGCESSQTV